MKKPRKVRGTKATQVVSLIEMGRLMPSIVHSPINGREAECSLCNTAPQPLRNRVIAG